MNWEEFITQSLYEDVRDGDHTSLSCIPLEATGQAQLIIKDQGIIAGMELAKMIFTHIDPSIKFISFIEDGSEVDKTQIAFELSGNARKILMGERLVLNCMQRMSGIATLTKKFVQEIAGFPAKILDTRKTTPLFREAEKWAVRIGGGYNHRFGLFDMILIKDNHIDYAGGIINAIESVKKYLTEEKLDLRVEIEARSLEDVVLILKSGGIDRIMLDNFNMEELKEAVACINQQISVEVSGGVNLDTVRNIAATGVDYISVGALTHSYHSIDLSLKAKIL
ncbi:MAG: carboxylating nicotinate-nucleotide diphosphorylase [Chitinophagales bacterium]|nr:carboxylating nicotinate-nucleotide diphosphorylase [Chitinophagales bacterium]